MFFGPIRKTRWLPWPLIGWDIFNFSSETAEQNSTKLDRKQDLNVLYQVCVSLTDWKNKMAALASDLLRHFRLLLKLLNKIQQNSMGSKISMSSTKSASVSASETAERNLMKLDRKQDLNVFYQVCVFRADQKKQDGGLGLWLTETFSTSPQKPLNRIQWNLI